ncbi:terminase large subunit [Rhizobium rhizogenes]|uniref:terminase large subunit n=1 Tax=Rhizobium rhizogenes TaxID=359 RepID=UPI0015737A0B|nr:terminase TerL endonuclease subunit [Rhizobium rhizogenes]NTI22387.1 terminase large subunit [Rhizobium rhizogenes]QTG05972.1 terminase large subunit [Rhizobium rhizogenes]
MLGIPAGVFAKSAQKWTHVEKGEQYARDVLSGAIPAGKWVKLACKRHFDDLSRSSMGHNGGPSLDGEDEFPYYFDEKAANKVCRFIENLPHTKGKWAQKRQKLILEPWQCFKTIAIFGWKRQSDGMRRFRKAFVLESRKNGKSAWAAGVGLYMFCADNEFGAEIYSGATNEKQAWEVFKPARLMAKNTPELVQHYSIETGKGAGSNLYKLADGAKFETVVGNPGDGASPSCAIVDEYHEHDTDAMVSTFETGMGARDQPLLLIISTAGDNIAGPCYQMQLDVQKMLEGVIPNDELFGIIYAADTDVDWTTELALRQANPNYDISVRAEFLKSMQREAIQSSRKVGAFKTKHLNLWVQARDAYFNIQKWKESAQSEITLEMFRNQPVKIGLDLASKVDIAAVELLFRLDQCNCTVAKELQKLGYKYARFGRYYLPEKTISLGENEHYQGWVADKWITETSGDMIDYEEIRDDILDYCKMFQVEELAFDQHQARMMVSELINKGVNCVEVAPVVLNFSEPMKEIEGLIRSHAIAHNDDPVYTWMLSNVVAKPDKKDNVYPNKDRNENKIDGPVAQIMAMARWMLIEDTKSVYEERGLRTV